MTTAKALAQRSTRVCANLDCTNRPEPKDKWCLQCQLAGRTSSKRP